ncbi:MAG: hypothetical protein N2643_02685 [Endomicrobia bacterium]|nr:hypothetical protein [Endomicrobiia bacterium]
MYHKDLAEGRWFNFLLVEQMANVGSEVLRAVSWKNKGELEYSKKAIERALELLYLTIEDLKNKKFSTLKELTRVYETLVDYFYFDNVYNFSDKFWQKYFLQFIYKARSKIRKKL